MTNPNNAVGTNAGYNGRTTPNAFNDNLALYAPGIVSGWTCSPKSGMTVSLGGNGTDRDVAIARDNAGNQTTINNISEAPIDVTIDGAPSTGNRIDLIVAYVENPQQGAGATDVDFPSQVGLITVKGTAAGTPSEPNDTAIRSAITADGATGASAYYVVLAKITVGQGVTTIGSGVITQGTPAQMWAGHLINETVGSDKLTTNAVWSHNINWSTILGTITDTTFGGGWLDLGTVRIQWMNRQKTGLSTNAGGYNQWTENLPAAFGSANYTVVGWPIGDTGNVSGAAFISYARTTTAVGLNYNHTGAIGSGTLNYSIIAIGKKP